MKRILLSILMYGFAPVLLAQPQDYKLVVYNVENLFDVDGIAVFDDYKPFDAEGNPQYTPAHLLTKIQKITRLMSRYSNGLGPDIIMFVEIEADFSPLPNNELHDPQQILERYEHTTIERMLGEDFNDAIKDLPAEMLLLKGMHDAGLTGYDVAVAYDRAADGTPQHVQKNVLFSRLPIIHTKTRSHPITDARPILEAWVDVEGYELALFVNHWKSRASDADVEIIRLQNAEVLKTRLDELRAHNPYTDFILGGDFNSDYNQSHRYPYMEITAVNDVLRSVGDEAKVQQGNTDAVYNLWYEHPLETRGSDVFRGYWGTLMQIMISPGLYTFEGVQYIDNSFDVGRFESKNVYNNSMTPKRWHDFEQGGGYSDHLPISMKFSISGENDTQKKVSLEKPGVNDDEQWSPIAISYTMPAPGDIYLPDYYASHDLRASKFYDELFLVEAAINSSYEVEVNGYQYGLWSHTFNTRNRLAEVAGTDQKVRFIGRLGKFRGNWQFVIETEEYINPEF